MSTTGTDAGRGRWRSGGGKGHGKVRDAVSQAATGADGNGGKGGKGGGGKAGGGKAGGGKDGYQAGKSGSGPGLQKPTDDPNFVQWSKGMRLPGSSSGVTYVVEAYVASGSFSRVFRVRAEPSSREQSAAAGTSRRWGAAAGKDSTSQAGTFLAAKVMRKQDAYIQYTSNGPKEGELLRKLEAAQEKAGKEVLTMRCLDSFSTVDDAGQEYWCLILEWLDASLFDIVRANGNRGLHLSMVRVVLSQMLEQLRVLQSLECTHTDIKHKNCCLANTEHYLVPASEGGRPTLILTNPVVKFIDYGNAVFEGEEKLHPIHTKQFRAPEVLLNITEGWGPPSDTWTVGITATFLVSGQLIFNSHEPQELIQRMVQALGAFPDRLLSVAKDKRPRAVAERAAAEAGPGSRPQLASWLGLDGAPASSPEAACVELLQKMLALDPRERISAEDALHHRFLAEGGVGAKATPPPCPAGGALRTCLGEGSHGGKGGKK